MDWLNGLFTEQTFTQAVMVVSLICAAGLALGKIKILGISFGVAFVFFAIVQAIHPEPVPISKISSKEFSFIISMAFFTKISVSSLGISTSGVTLKYSPINQALPIIC